MCFPPTWHGGGALANRSEVNRQLLGATTVYHVRWELDDAEALVQNRRQRIGREQRTDLVLTSWQGIHPSDPSNMRQHAQPRCADWFPRS